jgi:hypothetical protein
MRSAATWHGRHDSYMHERQTDSYWFFNRLNQVSCNFQTLGGSNSHLACYRRNVNDVVKALFTFLGGEHHFEVLVTDVLRLQTPACQT